MDTQDIPILFGIFFQQDMRSVILFNGIMPVTGSLISKEILNNLAKAYGSELTNFHIIAVLLIAQFVYLLFNDAMTRIYSTVLQISGELVANHIKIKLLMRLYDPTEGMILLDGHDIKEYDVTALYDMFGIVFQDYGKYAVSVRENIAFGEVMKDIIQDEIYQAAVYSNAHTFIEQLPQKYDTSLMRYFESSGTELSIGQWQKIAIARAFYADSDILILDEPTASLDAIAEQEIFTQFETLRQGKSSIFVSHRLSSATTANKIVVLNNGTIEEIGNHSELMKSQGEYYKLFSTQARRYHAPIEDEMPSPPPMRPRPEDGSLF